MRQWKNNWYFVSVFILTSVLFCYFQINVCTFILMCLLLLELFFRFSFFDVLTTFLMLDSVDFIILLGCYSNKSYG